jgi:hypothetical protein
MDPIYLCEHCFNPVAERLALQVLYFQAKCGCIHHIERAFHPECVFPFLLAQKENAT